MCGRSYRPRPDNGSGDSPRPPFLTEFVNHIGKLALIEVIYHLFGGSARHRIHPHVQGPIRLKTKATRRAIELQAAHAQISEKTVDGRWSLVLGNFCKGAVNQLHLRPVLPLAFHCLKTEDLACNFERCRILIDPNQMTRCAEAFCDFETVSAQAHRAVDVGPTAPNG